MFIRLLITYLGLSWTLFDGEGGGNAGGSGEGAPAAGGATPPAGKGAPVNDGNTAPAAPANVEQTVPYSRFKEVNDELQTRKTEDQRKQDEAAAKAGDFEKVKTRIEGENGSLRETLTEVARRNAFYAAANGKVSNLRLAYIAAAELGLMGDLKVEIDLAKRNADVAGNVDDIVVKVLKANPELKVRASTFGDDRGGLPPGDGTDMDKLSPVQKMEYGYRERQRSGSRG